MNNRLFKDVLAKKGMFLLCVFMLSLAFIMVLCLFLKAIPIFAVTSLKSLIFSGVWHPASGKFGLAGFITGTFWVTSIAMIISIPLSIFTAIYLSEYVHKKLRGAIKPLIDLLAGISPVIYGMWGVIVVVPLVRDYLMPFLGTRLRFFPFISENYTGFCILSGGIVLAVMVFPIIISIVEEVMKSIPLEMREASLALGATKWQTIKHTVLRKSLPGIIAAVILGLSRAFGETMAVLMVAGCALFGVSKSIFDPAYPLPALIANTYGEMMSVPLYDSAVLLAALILLVITAMFNVLAWGILLHIERKVA